MRRLTDTSARSFDWLASGPIAHRALHGAGTGLLENSLPAIEAARDAGLAVEIDVQLTGDARVAVFHDHTLERLTLQTGKISQFGLDELTSIPLRDPYGEGERADRPSPQGTIPSLTQVLDVIGGRVPLYIEIKTTRETNVRLLCGGVRHALEGYRGHVAQMSFDPRIVCWLRDYDPGRCRGLVVGDESFDSLFKRLLAPHIVRSSAPDFLAVGTHLLSHKLTQRWLRDGGLLASWTVRTPAQLASVQAVSRAPIFEHPILPSDVS